MEDKIEGCQALKHLYGATHDSAVFTEVLGHLTPKVAEELYWSILVLKRDFNQAIAHIYKMKELLIFVEGCQGYTSMQKQLEVVSDICSNLLKFDFFKVMLFDDYHKAFYQCQELHPTAKLMVSADDPLCLEINEAKTVLVACTKRAPKFLPIVEDIIGQTISGYCIVPLFSAGKNLKGFVILANKALPFEAPSKTDEAILLHLGPVVLKSLKLAAAFERKNLHCKTLKVFSEVLMASAFQNQFHMKILKLREWCISRLGAQDVRVMMISPSKEVTPLTLFTDDYGLPHLQRCGEFLELTEEESNAGIVAVPNSTPVELCGLSSICFWSRKIHISPEGKNHLDFNMLMDLESDMPIVSLPILVTDSLPIGVLQLAGRIGGGVENNLNASAAFEDRVYDTLKQITDIAAFHCVQQILAQPEGYSDALLEKFRN